MRIPDLAALQAFAQAVRAAVAELAPEAPARDPLAGLHDIATVAEVAEVLGVSGPMIYNEINTGKLLAIRLGRGQKRPLYRVQKKNVREWLERRGR